MSEITQNVLRPAPGGIKGWVMAWGLRTGLPLFFRLLRWLRCNRRLGVVFATRYDEVREVFLNDRAFRVPYERKLSVIMGGKPFFLSMDDTQEYRDEVAAMRKVVRFTDIADSLIPKVESLGEKIVSEGNGQIEVVGELVRRITFELYQDYFGIPDPPGENLRVSTGLEGREGLELAGIESLLQARTRLRPSSIPAILCIRFLFTYRNNKITC